LEQFYKPPRIPPAAGLVQVNHCKNPSCANFGVPANPKPGSKDNYNLSVQQGTQNVLIPSLVCSFCGQSTIIKSNQGIIEELQRLSNRVRAKLSCRTPGCKNNGVPVVGNLNAYYPHGKTRCGSQRYKCRVCNKTLSLPSPTTGQKKPYKNTLVFRLLVNKMPLRRICETAGISMDTLFEKISFIHEQCRAYTKEQESRIPSLGLKRLYLAVDQQEHHVNWLNKVTKHDMVLTTIGTADIRSGYVFAMHPNFDTALHPLGIQHLAEQCGDDKERPPFRRYARLWLEKDYLLSMLNPKVRKRLFDNKTAEKEALQWLSGHKTDKEVKAFNPKDVRPHLPLSGVQVHSEYTAFGHFFYLKDLFKNIEKLRFYLDNDNALRMTCIGAMTDLIKQDRCDAFAVSIVKGLTVKGKQNLVEAAKNTFKRLRNQYPDKNDHEVKLLLISRMIDKLRISGSLQASWVKDPLPDMGEPGKEVAYLTDIHSYDGMHLARLFEMGSLHALDRFFMQARRRLSLIERPFGSSSAGGGNWEGYHPYNPARIEKVIEIFRVFYNYVQAGEEGKTPAMRLGLAEKRVKLEEILGFT
jgi:transposase-like protein